MIEPSLLSVNKFAAISILCAAHSMMLLRMRSQYTYMYGETMIGVGADRNDLIQSRICASLLAKVVHTDGR